MNESNDDKPDLRIADTPADDETGATSEQEPASPRSAPSSQPEPKRKHRRGRDLVERVPPGTLDAEIERINREKNPAPRLVEGLDEEVDE